MGLWDLNTFLLQPFGVDDLLEFKERIQVEKKGISVSLNAALVVGARRAALTISQPANFLP